MIFMSYKTFFIYFYPPCAGSRMNDASGRATDGRVHLKSLLFKVAVKMNRVVKQRRKANGPRIVARLFF